MTNKIAESKIDGAIFEYHGFSCKITERPDLYYLYQVFGHRESDNKDIWPGYNWEVWLPGILFERNLTFEQIRDIAISMMDGTFEGTIEVYGDYKVYGKQ